MTSGPRCSQIARETEEPLAGTAPVAERWLLLEHPGPWARQPLDSAPFTPEIAARIEEVVSAAGGRVLLIRHHGRQAPPTTLHWYAVDTLSGLSRQGTWSSPQDALAAARVLADGPSGWEVSARPMILVCTHATRDQCCAVLGRPMTKSLAAAYPQIVWECTHLGGHRFAGTMLLLPSGACYGGLEERDAVEVVRAQEDGVVRAGSLRGVTRWSAPVQAALVEALERWGPLPLDAVRPGRVESSGGGRTLVEVLAQGGRLAVATVVREELPPEPVSCGKGPEPRSAHRVHWAGPSSTDVPVHLQLHGSPGSRERVGPVFRG